MINSRDSAQTPVVKVGLALVRDRKVLLVQRQHDPWLILPGGKPVPDETDEEALERECREELSCSVDRNTISWLGEFDDQLADDPSRQVKVRLYSASLIGKLVPSAEIAKLRWHSIDSVADPNLAPSLRRQIIPRLAAICSDNETERSTDQRWQRGHQ
jgi:8-oxo-dGTP diphosphatase